MSRPRIIIHVFGICVFAGICFAQKPTAGEILKHVADTYRRLTSYEFTMVGGIPLNHGRLTLAAIPGKEALQDEFLHCLRDGETMFTLKPGEKEYDDALAGGVDLAEMPPVPYTCDAWLAYARNVLVDRWKDVEKYSASARLRGETTVRQQGGNIRCWIVEFQPRAQQRADVWIDESRFLVLHEALVDRVGHTEIRRELRSASIDAPPDAKLFAITVPPGFHRGSEDATLLGKLAPDFQFVSDGKLTSLSDLRGKTVILYFWATWWPNIDLRWTNQSWWTRDGSEAQAIQKLWHDEQFLNVELIGISYEPANIVKKFRAQHKLEFPNVMDESRQIHNAYGIEWLSTIIVVDVDGRIKRVLVRPYSRGMITGAIEMPGPDPMPKPQ